MESEIDVWFIVMTRGLCELLFGFLTTSEAYL